MKPVIANNSDSETGTAESEWQECESVSKFYIKNQTSMMEYKC